MAHLSEHDSSTTSSCTDVHSLDTFSRDVASYIEPRDPSITNHWMRPRPTHGTNLCLQFEHSVNTPEENHHLEVFLRIKPISEAKKQNRPLYEIQNKSLITKSRFISKMFNFSHIFSQTDSQVHVFNTMIKDNLFKFVDMHDFTLLTYGSSGSGKTYSLMGTDSQPGVIPRCLEFLFAKVQPDKQPRYKPIDGNALEELALRMKEKEIQDILSMVKSCGTAPSGTASVGGIADYRRMSHCLMQESRGWSKPSHNVNRYEVWVSFAEIYNESVHDLLRVEPPGRMQAPPKLKIIQSATHQPYIKGVRWVCVRSGIEAFAALEYGKRRLRYAHTNINSHSSRSHCLFTLKLISYKSDGSGAQVSTLRLCDLAGLERAKKTLNEGARLAESRNINTSLHILERCLAAKRSKQIGIRAMMLPYRESKLTQLLQNALSGREAIAMLVNINPEPGFFDETQRVLEFSALAAEILVNVEKKIDPMLLELKLSKEVEKITPPESFSDRLELSDDQSLCKEVSYLREKIERMQEEYEQQLVAREREVRKEISQKFFAIKKQSDIHNQENIDEIKEMMQTQHQWEMEAVTEYYKNRVAKMEEQQEKLVFYKQELKKAKERTEYLEKELESERAKNAVKMEGLLLNSQKLKEDFVKLTVENHHLELESEELAASFLLAEAKYESSQRHLKKAELTILNITGVSETADSDDDGIFNEEIQNETSTMQTDHESVQIEKAQHEETRECSVNDDTLNAESDSEGTLDEKILIESVDNMEIQDDKIEGNRESGENDESNNRETSTTNDETFQDEEIENELVKENERLDDRTIASDRHNDSDNCVSADVTRNNITVNLSLKEDRSMNNDTNLVQDQTNSLKETPDKSSDVFLSDFGRLSVSCDNNCGSIMPSSDGKSENDISILSGVNEMLISFEIKPNSIEVTPKLLQSDSLTGAISQPLQSDNVTEAVSESLQLDNSTETVPEPLQSDNLTEIVSESLQSDNLTNAVTEPSQSDNITEAVSEPLQLNNLTEAVSEPLRSDNITECKDDTNKLDSTSVHLNWVVRCEVMPDIEKSMGKENVADNKKITPEKQFDDVEERLVSGFYTVKKENMDNFNIMSGAKSSRRKLFARRPLDEVAAETRMTRSNRCLNFSTDSPECIIPPPISKPYVVEKAKSTRKKKLV